MTIYLYGVVEFLAINISIQVAWYYIATYPSWDTYLHGEFTTTLYDSHFYITIIWIECLLLEGDFLSADIQSCGISHKEVYVNRVILHSIHIAWYRRYEAADVTWAAGTAKPRLAGILLFCCTRERIWIEETIALNRDAREDTIIQRAFEDIIVL